LARQQPPDLRDELLARREPGHVDLGLRIAAGYWPVQVAVKETVTISWQKVDRLLDAAEQSIRQSFEASPERAVDRHLTAVATLTANWTINSARDLAWNNCLLLWAVRHDPIARGLLLNTLAASTALASQMLLVAV